MIGINQVIAAGNCVADREVRTTGSGGQVANLRLAATENFRNKDGQQSDSTEYVRCMLFGRFAEIAQQYLHKGDLQKPVGMDTYSDDFWTLKPNSGLLPVCWTPSQGVIMQPEVVNGNPETIAPKKTSEKWTGEGQNTFFGRPRFRGWLPVL